jgi:mono/diheme cytochrome c family protein
MAVLGVVAAVGASCAARQGDAELAAKGQEVFFAQGCHGCHNVGTAGSKDVGADLSRIGAKRSRAELAQWLRDPASQKPTAHMPRIAMPEPDAQALAAYLATLR